MPMGTVLKTLVAVVGMVAVGLIVWRLLERQGSTSDDQEDADDA